MKDKTFFLNTILAVVLGIVLLAAIIVRVFIPIAFLPNPGIPELVLLSLIALLFDHYLVADAKRSYGWIFGLSAVTFGVLPWAAGFVNGLVVLKMAVIGGVVFTVVVWLFSSMQDRMRSGSGSKVTPVICALALYLASQCFAGMIL